MATSGSTTWDRIVGALASYTGVMGQGPHEFELRLTGLSELRVPQDLSGSLRPFFILTDINGHKLAATKNIMPPTMAGGGQGWGQFLGSRELALNDIQTLRFRCNMDELGEQAFKLQLWHDAPALLGQRDECLAEGFLGLADLRAAPEMVQGGQYGTGQYGAQPGQYGQAGQYAAGGQYGTGQYGGQQVGRSCWVTLRALPTRTVTTTTTEKQMGPGGAREVQVSSSQPTTGIAGDIAGRVQLQILRMPMAQKQVAQPQVMPQQTTTTTTTTTISKGAPVAGTVAGQPTQGGTATTGTGGLFPSRREVL